MKLEVTVTESKSGSFVAVSRLIAYWKELAGTTGELVHMPTKTQIT